LDRLAIGEGIESALAAHLVGDCPAWAAGSVAQMAKIEIPDSIKHVLIYADNDKNGAGQKAAYALCKRLREEGKNADVRIAPDVDTDWVDWICNLSADDIAEVDE
jgi:putative DNA primase/helicase